jgi:6-pyruvoyltetrahydropterin/6-carboxytetrahydropterin synthase
MLLLCIPPSSLRARLHHPYLLTRGALRTGASNFRAPYWTPRPRLPSLPAMNDAYLTRTIRFAAAHRYHRPEWSAERNREVFGACNNPHGHGHNYRLAVTIAAPVDPLTGFSADLAALDALLHDEVTRHLDHQHLNHAVPEFADGGLIPTCENILLWIWPRIAPGIRPPARLFRLRLFEDDDLFVDFHGEDAP